MAPFMPFESVAMKIRRCRSVSAIHHSLEPATKTSSKVYTMKRYGSTTNISDVSRSRVEHNNSYRSSRSSHAIYHRDCRAYDEYFFDRSAHHTSRGATAPMITEPTGVRPTPTMYQYSPVSVPYGGWNRHFPVKFNKFSRHSTRDAPPPSTNMWDQWSLNRWKSDKSFVPLAITMYRQKLVGFGELEHFWLKPAYAHRHTLDDRYKFY